MPTYEYYCSNCKEKKEVSQKMSEPPLEVCPDCHHNSLKRLFSASVSLQFKGTGFYSTDYKKSGSSDTTPTKNSEK